MLTDGLRAKYVEQKNTVDQKLHGLLKETALPFTYQFIGD